MKPPLDAVDQALLAELHALFPVEHRPFALLGQKLGIPEEECLQRVMRLKSVQAIQGIAGVYDGASLGYRVSSSAMKLSPARADEAAAMLERYPGTAYLQRCEDAFSIWLTIAVAPHESLERTIEALHALVGAEETMLLPVLRLFKRSEVPDRLELAEASGQMWSRETFRQPQTLRPQDLELIRLTQEDLPVLEMPFAVLAEQANLSESELFVWMGRMQRLGHLSRFGAVLSERESTSPRGDLVVWKLPDDQADLIGERMAQSRYVSHCSRRPTYPGWPYPLVTLLHPTMRPELVERVAEQVGIFEHRKFVRLNEYQRLPLKLFSSELEAWWKEIGGRRPGVRLTG